VLVPNLRFFSLFIALILARFSFLEIFYSVWILAFHFALRPGPVRSQSPFGVEALGLLSPASPPKCAAFVLPCAASPRFALPSALGFAFLGSRLLFSVLSRSAPSPASRLPRAPSFSVFRFSPRRARFRPRHRGVFLASLGHAALSRFLQSSALDLRAAMYRLCSPRVVILCRASSSSG
jgi:hypothetical protein